MKTEKNQNPNAGVKKNFVFSHFVPGRTIECSKVRQFKGWAKRFNFNLPHLRLFFSLTSEKTNC